MSDEIDAALENLRRIKGSATSHDNSTSVASGNTQAVSSDPLKLAQEEVDRLFDEHDLSQYVERRRLHVCVARWKRRNGVCKYNEKPTQKRFGERMSTNRKRGHHVIGIDEQIIEDSSKEEFLDTVRHEVAHAVCYEQHGTSQKHNHHWKAMAAKLGADPSSCHNKKDTDYNYYIGCPNCGMTGGKVRRSKVIKQPFNRMCGRCDERGLVSFDAGDEMPEENGTVAVESLSWDNEEEWYEAGCP